MALFNCNFNSKYLGYDTQVNVILPENRDPYTFDDSKEYKFQVLYLLHGRGDDCNGWLRGTSIERYATKHRIAVIMPTAEDSFYLNSATGKLYFSYMTEELPSKMAQWFPISTKPEDTFIAGLSMGGYGTLKIGLTYPERFAAMGIFSAATMPDKLIPHQVDGIDNQVLQNNLKAVFGEKPYKKEDLPVELLESCIRSKKKIPFMVHYCGKQDFLYDMNIEFKDKVKELGQEIVYEEWEGIHDWTFWDRAIEKALNVFPLKNKVLQE